MDQQTEQVRQMLLAKLGEMLQQCDREPDGDYDTLATPKGLATLAGTLRVKLLQGSALCLPIACRAVLLPVAALPCTHYLFHVEQ